ncbi:esterase/lipase family protein [Acinetobacter guerrae]|uniref:esterase/lipase family protein n=1 Tax=Acinetobacter guerrae TaxID=1843371 RepID=UPI00128E41A9|nr:alpha/beta hydrolase [Acinetobacter guerrae]MPW42905.1 alpha/beta hydrolase [Acinetobacter guerrae]
MVGQFVNMLKMSILVCLFMLTGCQLVQLHENELSQSLNSKYENILTSKNLSATTKNIVYLTNLNQKKCLLQFDFCLNAIRDIYSHDHDAYHAAISELYLAKALELDNSGECSHTQNSCFSTELEYLDQSIRHSYAYLFDSKNIPSSRVFDHRQSQVRIFYNFAISKLLTRYYGEYHQGSLPDMIQFGKHRYNIDSSDFPHLKEHKIVVFRSSYNMNFSGFHTVNRTDGLGAEYVVEFEEHDQNNGFILDPIQFYKNSLSPNIHPPQVLPLTAIMIPDNPDQHFDIDQTNFKIKFVDPYLTDNIRIHQNDYTLTANYSAPYGYWLSQNHLGKTGYWTLLNKENGLLMPHVYMLEPYNPNKKVIVFIHGLASSPEAWVSLTNDIMGDQELREHYQVWQVFYSTNMPIFESRYQIYVLLTRAFQNIQKQYPPVQDAVLIGHSMGGVISRLLVSDQDISNAVIEKMNKAQYAMLLKHPVIRERFQFKAIPNFSRAIFIATPHRGTNYADRWFTRLARNIIKIPNEFYDNVQSNTLLDKTNTVRHHGLIENGASNLSENSDFMLLTKDVMPVPMIKYHSIIGNAAHSELPSFMNDGIVPYNSSHLNGASSEKIIKGNHYVQMTTSAINEMRRILLLHLNENDH